MDTGFAAAHICQLPPSEDVIVKYINSGGFVYLRRKLKKLMLVNEKLPTARFALKSDSSIRFEQERHLRKYYHMIHPFSTWCLYWAIFQCMVHIFCFLFLPIEISQMKNRFFIVVTAMDLMFTADNIINFFVGHFEENINYIILNQKGVAKKYLQTYFVIDFISSMNIYLTSVFHGYFYIDENTYFWFCKLVLFLKLLRLRNLYKHLHFVAINFGINTIVISTFQLIMFTIFFLLWYASAVIVVAKMEKHPELWGEELQGETFQTYVSITVKTIHLFLLFGREKKRSIYEVGMRQLITEIIITTAGVLFYVYLLAHLMQIVEKYRGSIRKNSNILIQLQEYCKYKNLNADLTDKIIQYYKFRYRNEHFREDYIMGTISQQLRESIIAHVCYELIIGVVIFNDVPTKILSKIVSAMEAVHYLENDIIVRAGEIGDCMYFLLSGTVAVYTQAGQELCHLKDGSNFGEIAIVSNQERVATVIAIEPCEMYKLTKWAFESIVAPYPELYTRIQSVALRRLESITKKK